MYVISPINFIAPQEHGAKPYQLKYNAPGFPATNIVSEEHAQKLEDVRGREEDFSIPKNGFAILQLEDLMTYEDYDSEDAVRQVYCKQVAQGVKELLGASRVQIFEHVLRKRHPEFPFATGEPYKYNQPTNTAHVDVTPTWAAGMAEHVNATKGIDLPSDNHQFVNIWKPLQGPIRDWPLAVCDASTLEDVDLQESDVVFGDRVVENYLVRFNPKQRWYYLSDQVITEAWVFLQADSSPEGLCGAPHSSFLHPDHMTSHQPRESIELRAIVYYEHGRSSGVCQGENHAR